MERKREDAALCVPLPAACLKIRLLKNGAEYPIRSFELTQDEAVWIYHGCLEIKPSAEITRGCEQRRLFAPITLKGYQCFCVYLKDGDHGSFRRGAFLHEENGDVDWGDPKLLLDTEEGAIAIPKQPGSYRLILRPWIRGELRLREVTIQFACIGSDSKDPLEEASGWQTVNRLMIKPDTDVGEPDPSCDQIPRQWWAQLIHDLFSFKK